MRIRIEPVKPKGLLKLAEELEQKQKEEGIELREDLLEILIRMREKTTRLHKIKEVSGFRFQCY